MVEAGGCGARVESVGGGAVSALSIGSARCLIGVCLPRLPPHCAGRAQEWGADMFFRAVGAECNLL